MNGPSLTANALCELEDDPCYKDLSADQAVDAAKHAKNRGEKKRTIDRDQQKSPGKP